MGPLLAWLPFLAAIVLAFAAGVAFSRINEAWRQPSYETRIGGFDRADVIVTTSLVALLIAVVLVWVVALVTLVHRGAV